MIATSETRRRSTIPVELPAEAVRQRWLFDVHASSQRRFKPIAAAHRPAGVAYRDIPGYLGYQAGDDGSIWSQWKLGSTRVLCAEWRRLHDGKNSDGYCLVKLYRDMAKGCTRKVHQLVLESFIGPCPAGQEVRHLDDNKSNNALANLCYGTRSQNQLDRRGKGSLKGEYHHQAKLTEADIRVIRAAYRTGASAKQLADRFPVAKETIRRIAVGKAWTHVA